MSSKGCVRVVIQTDDRQSCFCLKCKNVVYFGHPVEDDGKWELHHGDTILLSLSKAVDSNGKLGSGKR